MDSNLYPSVKLPNSCKHIDYIKSKAINQLLQLTHEDVVDNDRNQCYIPGCQNTDVNQLKTFVLMGYPPKKTYYSINYIGIGLYPVKSFVTDEWYTAYVPLNKACFKNDVYNVKRCLLRLIGNSKLWTTDSYEEFNSAPLGHEQKEEDMTNVFKFPLESSLGINVEEYIFATPSCMYATKPELSTPFEFEELDINLQILVQVKARPDSFIKAKNSLNISSPFDSCFPNSEIEWYFKSVEDVVAERLLFKIIRKKNEKEESEESKVTKESKEKKVQSVTLVSPNLNMGKQLASDTGFAQIENMYKFEKGGEAMVFDDQKNVLIKMKPTEKHNKAVFFLKSIVSNKKCEWDGDLKQWRVSRVFLYEAVKFASHLGLKVESKVLYEAWTWLKSSSVKSLPTVFDTNVFIKWLKEYPIYSFQRVVVDFSKEQLLVDVVPYNKELVAMFKERKSTKNGYSWDKEAMKWKCKSISELVADLLSIMPSLRESSQEEERFLESKGVFLASMKTNVTQHKRPHEQEKQIYQKRRRKGEPEDDTSEFVTKLIITVAAKDGHVQRLMEKLQTVVKKILPPKSSISSSGKVIMGGAGTAGIEVVQTPSDLDTWNQVSMCIVPDEEESQIPVDKYDQNLLASLIGDVFIVKESAIDYLLSNFEVWPGPHDSVNYTRWSFIINKCEPKCWGGVDFDGRQSLAQTGLFDDEDFYISGTNKESQYIRMLILLGCGNIVDDAKDAEYVIITDKELPEASELYK
ncbi:conserved hypothetical protein [Theileria orientalis strain Shintoku]|uniref:Uncharacterized protein n=1 Tax=Theileria orientalis strain Shintoku TaxID=869250 RepID=J4D6S5_THEOR|nr:conserved hypothetical protein [Theileria orientalis strain Shintoku]BAM39750.1 conserved hypothetical protein [Theileria orientalis strain Shintoku]|eukprot:XP_009690051.1 conserved hypothetical protein [Theileria orientalis strain Shintoku]